MVDAIVRVRGLSYRYPGTDELALDDIDLEVGRGEFVLLVGASGSGKSTLLRALNGLVPSYHGGTFGGEVEVEGLSTTEASTAELARHVGLVFQDPERQAVMSRVDNEVAFGLESLGEPPGEIATRVPSALGAVGLEDRARDMVSELSSGQAQRLALSSVLAMEPDVLALDEPTSQLDPEAAREFLDHLGRERGRRGVTVLLAEHRLERGLRLADRVLVLEEGRLAFDGSPQDFLTGYCAVGDGHYMTTLSEVFCGGPSVPHTPEEAREALSRLLSEGALQLERREGEGDGEALVRCEGLRFSYGRGGEVLRGADLELRAGEVLALVGPNGSGKTTLARHLNGLLRPDSGRVMVDGRDAGGRTVAELAAVVALLTQNPGDYLFERTVEAELRLSAQYRGLEGDGAEAEVGSAIDELGLEGLLDRFSWDLSAGQRQRVALGALLVGAPRVLVLDEPTRGMDAEHKAGLAALARRQAVAGKAVMLITHDIDFAARAATRFAVLEEGRVAVVGPPEEVFTARPAYSPVLWRASEGLGLPPHERPLSPLDLRITDDTRREGGSTW